MNTKIRCQSCGMPLGEFEVSGKKQTNFGTNANGTTNQEYCRFCFQHGKFTQPHLTVEGMVDRSVKFMTTRLNFSEEKARELSQKVIPTLKRWN